jgi:hypothetical protein
MNKENVHIHTLFNQKEAKSLAIHNNMENLECPFFKLLPEHLIEVLLSGNTCFLACTLGHLPVRNNR